MQYHSFDLAHIFSVASLPGHEPDLSSCLGSLEEDISLVDPEVFDGMTSARRVAYLKKRLMSRTVCQIILLLFLYQVEFIEV
jgi:hypothetical protein